MNDIPAPKLPLKDSCFLSLIYLKFAMGGDVESVELLRQLFDRYSAIEWDGPQFLADSEAMRGAQTVRMPDISDADAYRAMVDIQGEQIASRDETIVSMKPSLVNALEALKKGIEHDQKQAKFTSDLFDYIHKLIALHRLMRDQLEMLHADTSPYEFPALPKALQNE
jgi:hypothetical protein